MCCLFGLMDRSHHFSGKERSVMVNHLARASEARGTDATGIAYNSRKRMRVYKRPMAAHRLRLKVPEDAVTVIGHTRLTTQGSARFNENNHPWRCQISTGPFALAHNGVLYNDTALRRELALPTPKIQTDSYIAVQIIEQQRTLSFDSLKTNRATLLANMEAAVKFVEKRKEENAYGQISLFDSSPSSSSEEFVMEPHEDWTPAEKLESEKALLGFYVSGHPLDQYAKTILEMFYAQRIQEAPYSIFGR